MQQVLPRFFIFLYLSVALMPGQIQEELGKLPQLAAHFQLHQQENPSTTLWSFLSDHYGAGFARHQSEHSHENLPGKAGHVHFACSCQQLIALPAHFEAPFSVVSINETLLKASFGAIQFPSSQYFFGIWQPPKSIPAISSIVF